MSRIGSKTATVLVAVLFLAACAFPGVRSLRPGESSQAEVEQVLGAPALRWREADGGEWLAYPRGPAGYQTYMARIGPDGRLVSLQNVLEPGHFSLIRAGMSQDEVLHVLGPPFAPWTVYFESRDELAWEWRYCNDWAEPARFNVFFDGTSGRVRSTGSLTERQRFGDGSVSASGREWCHS